MKKETETDSTQVHWGWGYMGDLCTVKNSLQLFSTQQKKMQF